MPTVLTETAVLSVVTDDEPRADGPRPAPALCPNCGEPRAGRFCAECGQREMGGRLTLRALWTEFASRVFNLNRGLLHTVVSLAKSPGAVPCDYVAGRRRTYTNPLSFLLLAATLSVLATTLHLDTIIEANAEMMGGTLQEQRADYEAEHAGHDHDKPDFVVAFEHVQGEDGRGLMALVYESITRFSTQLLFLLALFLVAPLRVLFGPVRNVAEVSVFSLYVVGLCVLLGAVVMLFYPLVVPYGQAGMLAVAGLTLVAYCGLAGWGATAFFEPGWSAAARGVAAMLVAYAGYYVAVMIVGMVYVFGVILDEAGMGWGELLHRLVT